MQIFSHNCLTKEHSSLRILDTSSSHFEIVSVVSKGFVLGPLIFTLFTEDSCSCNKYYKYPPTLRNWNVLNLPVSGSTPETGSLRLMALFKNSYKILMKIRNSMSTTFLLNFQISALDPPLIKSCCRLVVRGGWVRGSCERMDMDWPTD
jgi:hypothetical protein